ncbi:hypothetical protein ACIQNI_14290 [Streptomyces sp. NPDC091266]|uniref:hypothetical protein n=1 Tax=Streptomyces sp. NPDC091266 TaxID=3365978 RepID=UPI003811676D
MAQNADADAHARVLALLCDRLATAPDTRQRVLWRLAEPGRGLDANLVRLPPDGGVDAHSDDVLDVLLVVLDGSGHLTTPEGRQDLVPGAVAWLPRTSSRSLRAGASGLVHLTVHRRRPGLSIGGTRTDDATDTDQTETARTETTRTDAQGTDAQGVDAQGSDANSRTPGRSCPSCARRSREPDARFCSGCGHALAG